MTMVPFPNYVDSDFVLSQYDYNVSSTPSVPAATSTIVVSTAVSTVVSIANQAHSPLIKPPSLASTSSTRVYSSPKGNEAVNAAKASSIPVLGSS